MLELCSDFGELNEFVVNDSVVDEASVRIYESVCDVRDVDAVGDGAEVVPEVDGFVGRVQYDSSGHPKVHVLGLNADVNEFSVGQEDCFCQLADVDAHIELLLLD
jgi:hypothetical protein